MMKPPTEAAFCSSLQGVVMFSDETRVSGHRIAGLARSTEAASIGLIDAIDGTVDALTGIASVMSGFDRVASSIADEIKIRPVETGKYLDPDDEAIDALKQAASCLKDFLALLVRKRSAINRDARLKDHHCEALHDAYEASSGAIAELIESLESLRATIISHDLAAEPRDAQAFSTVEALVKNLRGQ